MAESTRVRELRQELAELRDPGLQDKEGHALFLVLQKSYLEELELLGAPVQPSEPRRPPLPRLIHATKSHRPVTQEVRHADSPGHAGAPGAASPTEEPMPKPAPAASSASPEERLDTLLAKLSNATAAASTALDKSAFLKARGHIYQHRNDITKLVSAHGLEEPQLPRVPTNPWAYAPGKAGRPHPKQDAPPQHLEAASDPDAAMLPEPFVIEHEDRNAPLSRMAALPLTQGQILPEAVSRLRALRVQALEVLPLCEGLDREAAFAIRHQVDLLADVLAMADRLAREAS